MKKPNSSNVKQNCRRQEHGDGLRVDVPPETVPDWCARLILTDSMLGGNAGAAEQQGTLPV